MGIALTLAAAAAAPADPPPPTPMTLAQFEQRQWSQLIKMGDTNHDGRISHDEFKAAAAGRANGLAVELGWLKLNANHDGFITRAEWDEGWSKPGFEKLDRNHDGILDAAEVQAARQRR